MEVLSLLSHPRFQERLARLNEQDRLRWEKEMRQLEEEQKPPTGCPESTCQGIFMAQAGEDLLHMIEMASLRKSARPYARR